MPAAAPRSRWSASPARMTSKRLISARQHRPRHRGEWWKLTHANRGGNPSGSATALRFPPRSRGNGRARHGINARSVADLSADESAASRDHLLLELAKNQLTTDGVMTIVVVAPG